MKSQSIDPMKYLKKSPPSRGAWIEILIKKKSFVWFIVAPLAGGVD